MRIRHNKKRNTAFVFESLIRSATLAILKKDHKRKEKIIQIVKEQFAPDSVLKKDLECYRSLYAQQALPPKLAEKILYETRRQRSQMCEKELFEAQTALINRINKHLGPETFTSFVPNYKALATISQFFSSKGAPKDKMLLENKILAEMITAPPHEESGTSIDKTVYKVFVEKFNTKYDGALLPEQKELLNCYVSSFADNALSLKVFLNEELSRLKKQLATASTIKEFKEDPAMLAKAEKLILKLESYAHRPCDEGSLLTILRTQTLVKEIQTNGDRS
jgi:hypothetical protein